MTPATDPATTSFKNLNILSPNFPFLALENSDRTDLDIVIPGKRSGGRGGDGGDGNRFEREIKGLRQNYTIGPCVLSKLA